MELPFANASECPSCHRHRFPVARLSAGPSLFALGMLAASLASAQVVKCVDAQGRVEYARTCPTGSTQSGRVQPDVTPAPAPPSRAASGPAAIPAAGGINPSDLDNAEDNICMAQGGLTRARAALNERGTLPVEQLSGPVPDARRREFLQQKLDEGLRSGQMGIVASQEKDLARYQAEYRRLTGSEFNTVLCGDTQRRIRRRDAWEARRREEMLSKDADKVLSNEAEGIRQICSARQSMGGPPKDMAHVFTADQVKDIQDRSKERYMRLTAAYERSTNRRFDPAQCR